MDVLDGIDEDNIPEVKERGMFHKLLIVFACLFMILLLLSYFLVGPGTLEIIEGMFVSDVLDESQLVVAKDNLTLSFSREVYSELRQMYLDNPEHEFKACLHGTKDGESYMITDVVVPETFEQAFDHVVAELCPADALIDFHSHPEKHCIPSYHDVQLLRRLKESNPALIMAVMCNLDRFSFYT